MSQDEYVQLEQVRKALEKVINDENAIEEVLELLGNVTVAVPDAGDHEDPGADEGAGADDSEKLPKQAMQSVIVVSDPQGLIKTDLTGWFLQLPENEDSRDIIKNVRQAAYNYNASKKGNKYPVSTIGQAIETVPNKFFKAYGIKRKTKEAVYVVPTDNKLPKE